MVMRRRHLINVSVFLLFAIQSIEVKELKILREDRICHAQDVVAVK